MFSTEYPSFDSARAADRVTAIRRAAVATDIGAADTLKTLLDDDAPIIVEHGGDSFIVEVRAVALDALGWLYRRHDVSVDFGPVLVRRGMRCDLAIQLAHQALGAAEPLDAIAAYGRLQQLGQVPYQTEYLDPLTRTTPMQDAVHQSQLESARPRPHLRVAGAQLPQRTLGYLYRDGANEWTADFAEGYDSDAAMSHLNWALYDVRPNGVPQLRRDASGVAVRGDGGGFVFDGVVPLDASDAERVLVEVADLVQGMVFAELCR
jgi:hypothetical protein